MGRLTIARHGNITSAKAAPRTLPAGAPLPGSTSIQFADGHVEVARLQKSCNQL